MIVLLALLAAGFCFAVRAGLRGVYARQYQYQARIAAEAGIQRAIVQLRKGRDNPENWYDNRAVFRQASVERLEGSATFQRSGLFGNAGDEGETSPAQADPAWRFTLYADNLDDERSPTVRYGLTPETGKLDVNLANEDQLRRLIFEAVPESGFNNQQIDRESLVQCLLDWREPGQTPRPLGAKSDYYRTLRPGYACKGARLDTVEELLLIKGFTAWVVYGEDYNRNGLLDVNEDDGNASFPPDNADGRLFRGLAPLLTTFSRELNTNSLGKPRINLNMQDVADLEKQLNERGVDGKLTDYILRIRAGGLTFNSVMNLLPVPPPDEEEIAATQPDGEEGTATQPDDEGDDDATTQPGEEPAASQPTTQPRTSRRGRDSRRQPTTRPTTQPREELKNLTDEIPPGTIADLPVILDQLTTDPRPIMMGRINITTAPREVLRTLAELDAETVTAILSKRGGLSGDDKRTCAWLLSQDLVSERKFRRMLPRITAGSSTFSIDAVGFADHVGVVRRLNAVIEMRGPIGQVLYYRDLTPLGPAYRPHGEEIRSVVRQAGR